MYSRNPRGWWKHVDFFIVDAITLHLVLLFTYGIRYNTILYTDLLYVKLSLKLLFCDAFVFLCFNTMHNVVKRGFYVEFKVTLRHCASLFMLAMLLLYFQDIIDLYSRTILYSTAILHVFMGYISRVFWKWFIRNHHVPVVAKRLILAVLGADTAQASMDRIRRQNLSQHSEFTGIIMCGESDMTSINGIPVVAHIENAANVILQESVDAIYIDCPLTDAGVSELLDACIQMAIPISYQLNTPYGEGMKHFVEKMGGQTVLTTTVNFTSPYEQIAKRGMDLVGGLFGSIVALFLILIIGPKIKKASPGPILYTQERVGLNGRHFKIYKLRSMYMDADQRKQELMDQNQMKDSRMFKIENDPRIIGNEVLPDGTVKKGIGDFIRRTSLDEFPQFFNVLRGQMSLVGTRPPTVDEWDTYEFHHRARLACKPGITGLWQVSGRSKITDFEEVVKLDTQYISNWSIGLDIRILLKTISTVFSRKGAF